MTSEHNLTATPFHEAVPDDAQPQLQQRLLYLTTQLDHMQAQLDDVLNESQTGASQIAVLTQNLTNPQAAQILHERLAELATQIESSAAQLDRLTQVVATLPQRDQINVLAQTIHQTASREQLETLMHLVGQAASQEEIERLAAMVAQLAHRDQLDELSTRLAGQADLAELAGELKRMSRTQFKSNALSESKEQQTATALTTLREIATRRAEIQDERTLRDQQRLDTLRAEARGDLAADLLPALDGLELAIENGRALLDKHAQQPRPSPPPVVAQPPAEQRSWLRRVFGGEPERTPVLLPPPEVDTRVDEMRESLAAWLDGLNLVRERFLTLLAAEGVRPIPAQEQPFDPRLHVAVETVTRTDMDPNTVVRVIRQGYRQHKRVLRYAEVVVARAAQ